MSRAKSACRFAAVLLLGLVSLAGADAVKAEDAGEEHATQRQSWPFAGFRGQFDQAQLQRGFQIYQNVCSACHGLKRVRFRNLAGKALQPLRRRQCIRNGVIACTADCIRNGVRKSLTTIVFPTRAASPGTG